MTQLMLLSIGPVQEFIAQARRMHDLWFGSHLLSEMSKAAARYLADEIQDGGELIFPPHQSGDKALEFSPSPSRKDETTGLEVPVTNVANKILLRLPDGYDNDQIKALAKGARDATRACLITKFGENVKHRCRELLADGINDVWKEQLSTAIECYAVWSPLSNDDAYGETLMQLEKALSARKNVRAFLPWQHRREGAPKSSLDGVKESILAKKPDTPEAQKQYQDARLYINAGEQLDAIGLIKRRGGKDAQFVSHDYIAMIPWLKAAQQHCPEKMSRLQQACADLELPEMLRVRLEEEKFRYDAGLFREERWPSLLKEPHSPFPDIDWFKRHVTPVLQCMRQGFYGNEEGLFPCVACLVGDGDKVGKVLNALTNQQAHQAFSKALAAFAEGARELVKDNDGLLIYAGGDDVMAFLPVATSLQCAQQLQEQFMRVMENAIQDVKQALSEEERESFAAQLQREDDPIKPTFSVGVGIGHVRENMGNLLALGRDAETQAKGDVLKHLEAHERRNALAVIVDKRSGGVASYREQWHKEPVKQLIDDAERLRGQRLFDSSQRPDNTLPSGKIYEVRTHLQKMPAADTNPREHDNPEAWYWALRGNTTSILARADRGKGKEETDKDHTQAPLTPEDVGLHMPEEPDYKQLYYTIEAWVERMLIARVIAESVPQPKHNAPTTQEEAA